METAATKTRIGYDIDLDKSDKIYFQIKPLMESFDLTHEEKMVLCCNLIYDSVVSYYYDKNTHKVDTDKAHAEFDRLIQDVQTTIDESNDQLYINPDHPDNK